MTDRDYMLRAVELAKRGVGWTNPNPLVGAVIVKEGRIIGEGWHRKYGGLHAEREAIASLTESAEGATLYVTLEPCCHHGKTPPCTDAILEQKMERVVIGSRDPNPLVAGKGAALLRDSGVKVDEDFMRKECDSLNPIFFHYIVEKTPYVVMKYAMTADGKTASRTGASKWITGGAAREMVHRMRHSYMGIMAGIGTVLADDPMLNTRIPGLKSPVRIICDSRLRIPLDSRILKSAREYRTIIACASAQKEKINAVRAYGAEVLTLPDTSGRVDLKRLMNYLGESGIDSILLEGGGRLNEGALKEGIVKEIKAFMAPKIFGGEKAPGAVMGEGVFSPGEAYMLELKDISRVGEDILLEYLVR